MIYITSTRSGMLFIRGMAHFFHIKDLYGKPIIKRLSMSMKPYQGTSYFKQCPPPSRTGETSGATGEAVPDLVQIYCQRNCHPHPAHHHPYPPPTKNLNKHCQHLHFYLTVVMVIILIYLAIPGCLTLLTDTFFP